MSALTTVEVQGGDPLVVEVILPAEQVVQVVEVVTGAQGPQGPPGLPGSGVDGSFTAGRVPKATGATSLADSAIEDTGTGITVAGTLSQGVANPNASYQGIATLSATYNEVAVYGDYPATNLVTSIAHDNVAGYLYTDAASLNISGALFVKIAPALIVHFGVTGPVDPIENGQLAVQATSNTQLTFKLKGSDGVVRSGSITLV